QMVMHEVAVAADAAHAADEGAEPVPLRGAGHRLQVASRDDRCRYVLYRAHPDSLIIQKGTGALLGPSKLAVSGSAGDAQHQTGATHQCDLGGEERTVADEGLGAVDGIHQPDALGICRVPAGFLAIKAVA